MPDDLKAESTDDLQRHAFDYIQTAIARQAALFRRDAADKDVRETNARLDDSRLYLSGFVEHGKSRLVPIGDGRSLLIVRGGVAHDVTHVQVFDEDGSLAPL